MTRGKKTSIIDHAKILVQLLNKEDITDISYGIIVSVRGRKDHRTTIKLSDMKGGCLMQVTGKRYKQEVRIYEKSALQIKRFLVKSLGEQFRILN